MSRRVGSVDEEARLLADTLRRACSEDPGPVSEQDGDPPPSAPTLRLVGPAGDLGAHGGSSDGSEHRPCTSCPLCQAGSWGREHGPEILRSLADVAGLAAEGLRAFAAALEESRDADTGRDRPSEHRSAQGRDATDVDEEERA